MWWWFLGLEINLPVYFQSVSSRPTEKLTLLKKRFGEEKFCLLAFTRMDGWWVNEYIWERCYQKNAGCHHLLGEKRGCPHPAGLAISPVWIWQPKENIPACTFEPCGPTAAYLASQEKYFPVENCLQKSWGGTRVRLNAPLPSYCSTHEIWDVGLLLAATWWVNIITPLLLWFAVLPDSPGLQQSKQALQGLWEFCKSWRAQHLASKANTRTLLSLSAPAFNNELARRKLGKLGPGSL